MVPFFRRHVAQSGCTGLAGSTMSLLSLPSNVLLVLFGEGAAQYDAGIVLVVALSLYKRQSCLVISDREGRMFGSMFSQEWAGMTVNQGRCGQCFVSACVAAGPADGALQRPAQPVQQLWRVPAAGAGGGGRQPWQAALLSPASGARRLGRGTR